MLNADLEKELNALRESLPTVVESDIPSKTAVQSYSQELARRIVDYRAQGLSLHQISLKSEMPAYSTLLRWRIDHPEFARLLRSVCEARAGHFEDAAIEAAEKAEGKDADRLKFEAYKWAAEVNDPATYGKKLAHSGEVGGKVVLQVVTGFGPPNKWQTPPKLRADGTIDVTPIEEADGQGTADHGKVSEGDQDNPPTSTDGHHDAPVGDSAGVLHGDEPL